MESLGDVTAFQGPKLAFLQVLVIATSKSLSKCKAHFPVNVEDRYCLPIRRPIGTFHLLAQKLAFSNLSLDKSTTEPPFVRSGIWNIHVHKVRDCEVYAYEA